MTEQNQCTYVCKCGCTYALIYVWMLYECMYLNIACVDVCLYRYMYIINTYRCVDK